MCNLPYIVINPKTKQTQKVPCNNCEQCLKTKAGQWGFRLKWESYKANTAYFITLTYNQENVPINKYYRMTLQKSDVQNFLKRLRYFHRKDKKKIVYYCAGEYGTRFKRPHYHLIIFNASIENIEKSWKKGTIHYGQVNEQTVAYTLKYIQKKPIKQYKKQQEFAIMSQGIGLNYVEKYATWHKQWPLDRYYLSHENYKISIPRYYKEKIYTKFERLIIQQHLEKEETKKDFRQRALQGEEEYHKNYQNKILVAIQRKNWNAKKTYGIL